MRLVGRMSLQAKVLLIQTCIVVLVAGLITATVVSVLANRIEQQAGDRALGIAQVIALMPAVRSAFDAPDPPAIIQPLAESIRQSAGVSFVVVSNRDLIRYSHPNPELIGRTLLDPPPAGGLTEDDRRPLRGESVVVQEDGSLGRSIRAKVPVYDQYGGIVGAVSVGITVDRVQDKLLTDIP